MMIMTKRELRQTLGKLRDVLTPDEQQELSKAVSDRLFCMEVYKQCDMVFTYLSFRSEVHTKEIIGQALADGKKVYLPRIKQKDMNFYEMNDLDSLITSHYGIPEPPEEEKTRFIGINENTGYQKLMLLPGLAFDPQGNRIGYGAGYYDKYLSKYEENYFYKIALAYDLQVINRIEADVFDIKADAILTPTRLLSCQKQRNGGLL
jgi:5-formyltetrahydrofolate cyclo-ligase